MAAGHALLKSSLLVGCLRFPLVSAGPVMQREWDLHIRGEEGNTSECVRGHECVQEKGTVFDRTHSCFDMDVPGRVEKDLLPQQTKQRGESRGGG